MSKKIRCNPFFCRAAFNLFILFFIFRSICMCWPFEQEYNPRRMFGPINSLSAYLGLNTDLGLFSPNPPEINDNVKFVVMSSDGCATEWRFPRDKMTPWDSEHSYQQYVRNMLFWRGGKKSIKIRPELARYIVRQASVSKRPVRVDFFRSFEPMPPPEVGIGKPLLSPQNFEKCFSYVVQPGDLN